MSGCAGDITSQIVDTQLLLTIAQVSATFIAILAALYTTKIISLANGKNTILQKIKSLENEVRFRQKHLAKLEKNISDIIKADDEEYVNSFIDDIKNDFFAFEQISSFEGLKDWFTKYDIPLSENQEKILKERSPGVLDDLRKKREDRNEHPNLVRVVHPHQTNENVQSALYNQEEVRQFNELEKERKEEETQISFLKHVADNLEIELRSIVFPNIKLGFFSFILFAVLGVVIPLSYRWWTGSLKDVLSTFNVELVDINVCVLILFCIGLTMSFVYIGQELYHALHMEKK